MCVYFIENEYNGLIKIGKSKSVMERMKSLANGHKDDALCLLGRVEGYTEKEAELHDMFREFRVKGEWFTPSDSILDYIDNFALDKNLEYIRRVRRCVKHPIRLESNVSNIAKKQGIEDYQYLSWICKMGMDTAKRIWEGDISHVKINTLVRVSAVLRVSVVDLYELEIETA